MTQKIQLTTIALLLIGGAVVFMLALDAPEAFPEGKKFTVSENESLHSVSERLESDGIITSALFFRGWVSVLGQDEKIGLGVYEFNSNVPLGVVVAKFVKGPDEPLLSVTIPEGYTTKEVADAFKKVLPAISLDVFGELVYQDKLDGYLFPSTYYPLPSFTESDIIARLKATFDKEYEKHFKGETFPKQVPSKQDVVSLAAILEGEANTPEDMKIVSGILQKRLEKGMRLQVDVAQITYRESGIPDQPINNPGIVALDAVFNPVSSSYLYYLTGKDGRMYYAKTFEDHKKNIERYLR
jgi:UPF0755 protein